MKEVMPIYFRDEDPVDNNCRIPNTLNNRFLAR